MTPKPNQPLDTLPAVIDEWVATDLADKVALTIPPACMAGVVANLYLLAEHAARLDDAGPA